MHLATVIDATSSPLEGPIAGRRSCDIDNEVCDPRWPGLLRTRGHQILSSMDEEMAVARYHFCPPTPCFTHRPPPPQHDAQLPHAGRGPKNMAGARRPALRPTTLAVAVPSITVGQGTQRNNRVHIASPPVVSCTFQSVSSAYAGDSTALVALHGWSYRAPTSTIPLPSHTHIGPTAGAYRTGTNHVVSIDHIGRQRCRWARGRR